MVYTFSWILVWSSYFRVYVWKAVGEGFNVFQIHCWFDLVNLQILAFALQSRELPSQLDPVHLLPASPSLPVHHDLRSSRHASLWWEIRPRPWGWEREAQLWLLLAGCLNYVSSKLLNISCLPYFEKYWQVLKWNIGTSFYITRGWSMFFFTF